MNIVNILTIEHKDFLLNDDTVVQQTLWPLLPASVTNVDLSVLDAVVPQELLDSHPDFNNYVFKFYRIFTDATPLANTAYIISGPVKGVSDLLQYRNWVKALEGSALDLPLEVSAPGYWIALEAEGGNHANLDLWKKAFKDTVGYRVIALPGVSLPIEAFFEGLYGANSAAIQAV